MPAACSRRARTALPGMTPATPGHLLWHHFGSILVPGLQSPGLQSPVSSLQPLGTILASILDATGFLEEVILRGLTSNSANQAYHSGALPGPQKVSKNNPRGSKRHPRSSPREPRALPTHLPEAPRTLRGASLEATGVSQRPLDLIFELQGIIWEAFRHHF